MAAYQCFETDRDVRTQIYRDGNAITLGDIVDRLNWLERLERKVSHGCIDANCIECDPPNEDEDNAAER